MGKVYENCTKIKEKVLFYETYFEESNINWKPIIWFQDEMITKFEKKNCASLVLRKVYKNYPKMKEKMLFDETYFKKSNINQKPLIWPQDKIITKFGQKNR